MLINLKIIVVITNLLSCWVIICTLLDPIIKRWKHKGITWLWAGANKTSKSNPQYWPLAFFAGTLLWSQNLRCCFVRTAQGQSPQMSSLEWYCMRDPPNKGRYWEIHPDAWEIFHTPPNQRFKQETAPETKRLVLKLHQKPACFQIRWCR